MGGLRYRLGKIVLSATGQPRDARPAGVFRVLAAGRAALSAWVPHGAARVRMVTLLALLFWAVSVSFVSVVRYGGDFRALLCLGERVYHPAALDAVPKAGPAGYDGQQYGALATDPLLLKLDTPQALDSPAYRATRFLLPLTAWALALGQATWAVVAYQLLCWGLGLAAVHLVARWLVAEGRSPWWALPLAGGAGLVASIFRSTPDAAAVFLILLALWLYGRDRTALALATAVAAVLTRETSYLAVIAIVVDQLRRRRIATAALFASLPLAFMGAWQLYLKGVLGTRFFVNKGRFTVPFAWLGEKVPTLVQASGIQWQEVFGLVAIVATTVALVMVAFRPSTWAPPELTFLAFGALGLALTYDVYIETWGYARILLALPFLSTLIAERQGSPFRKWTLRAISVFYLLAGLVMMRWEVATALSGRSVLAAVRDATSTRTGARASVTGGPVRAPAGIRPLYVLPVANVRGRSDALWRTKLEVTNLAGIENMVLVELLPAGRPAASSLHTIVTLSRDERRSWENLAGDLFGFSGTCAVCLFASTGPIAAGSLTTNSLAGPTTAPLLAAVNDTRATPPGGRAAFRGLYYDPAREAAVRTNIGLLNLSSRPLRVRIEAFDALTHPLGHLSGALLPRGFLQVDDVFRRVGAGAVAGGSVVVEALTDGAFLSYASVIRGPSAPALYLLPEPSPAAR